MAGLLATMFPSPGDLFGLEAETQRFLAESTINSPIMLAIVTGMLGAFGGGTVAALFKIKPDKQRIIVDAAQGAVVVQSGVIESLRAEMVRVEDNVTSLQEENRRLRRRVRRLEHEIRLAGLEIPIDE